MEWTTIGTPRRSTSTRSLKPSSLVTQQTTS